MKRTLFFILCLGSWFFSFAQVTGYVVLQGKQFKDGTGNDFYPLIMNVPFEVVNYNGNVMLSNALQSDETNQRDCDIPSECEDDIIDCFEKVQDMGFNCIRVMGLEPRFVTNHAGFTGFVHRVVEFPWNQTYPQMTQPYSTDNETNLLIDHYEKLLQIAAQMPQPFYIIFNTLNYYEQDVYTQLDYDINTIDPYYAEFLSELAARLQQYPALLAYDLFNEPYLYDHPLLTKGNICELVDNWSTAIKLNDGHHLITLNNNWEDIIEWEPGVMKIDFYSVHIYNARDATLETGAENYAESLKRLHGMAIWLSSTCAMPWIMGEASYSCFNGLPYPDVDGSEAQQRDFAQASLDIVRNCGGSGYSWWKLQESDYGDYQDGFGLLYNSHSFTEPASSTTEKPAVDVFRNYLINNNAPTPVSISPPSSYYDPFNNGSAIHNATHTNAVSGTILDANGDPIENALIQGVNWLSTDNSGIPTLYLHSWIYSFSNGNATDNFEIIPYHSPIDNPDDPRIVYIRGSISGAERFERGGWEDVQIATDVGDIFLDFANPVFNASVDNEFVNIGVTQNHAGLSTLTVSNMTIDGNGNSGGISELTARNEVHVNSEFHAKKGSNVHIFTSEVFIDCNEVNTFSPARTRFDVSDNTMGSIEIELKFDVPDSGTVNALVIPNPTSGIVRIKLLSKQEINASVIVNNMQGQQLESKSMIENNVVIDGSTLAKGIYIVVIKLDEKSIVKKLIIN